MKILRLAQDKLAAVLNGLRRIKHDQALPDGSNGAVSDLGTAATMRQELASVLDDPVLARSPIQARLLEYLVEATLDGRGKTLKSYSVAVDGLGRTADFDAQVDTYARVQVGRLRKLLDNHYAGAGAHRSPRLAIGKGSYEVELVVNASAQSPQPAGASSGSIGPNRSFAAAATVVGLISFFTLFFLLVTQWQSHSRAATERWRTSDFPFVGVSVGGGVGQGKADHELIRQSMIMALDKYEGIRVSYGEPLKQNYTLSIYIDGPANNSSANVFVIDDRLNRVVWSTKILKISNSGEIASDYGISRIAFIVSHPTGVIHSYERRRKYTFETPYGCWLRFTAHLQNNMLADPDLENCAREWYEAAPNHPLAAGLYGWTRIDQSIVQLSEGHRQETIRDAIEALQRARRLNPNSPLLNLASMRAYAFAGDGEAMHAAGIQALKLNPENLDIQGMVGMMLSFWNDPQGEALLGSAIARHFNPPPWYFVGQFTAAMSRDDTEEAGRALKRLQPLRHSLAIYPVLSAALEARTGNLTRARKSWERAKSMQPVLRIDPELFLRRLPVAPVVRSRLREWLSPLLK